MASASVAALGQTQTTLYSQPDQVLQPKKKANLNKSLVGQGPKTTTNASTKAKSTPKVARVVSRMGSPKATPVLVNEREEGFRSPPSSKLGVSASARKRKNL